jgi:putative ABC transport system permease protein
MIRNYLKIAIRNLRKQVAISSINILGLSIGIACFMLIILFAAGEFSFDRFHKNAPDIYRLYTWNQPLNGRAAIGWTDYYGAVPIGEAMRQSFKDVVDYTRLQLPWGDNLVRVGNNVHRAKVSYADPAFFSIFTFPLKYGNTGTALRNLNDIVLTESRARELFGTDNAVGKTIEISIGTAFIPFKVAAVAKDIPANSTVRFDLMGNYGFAQNTNEHQFLIGSNWHPIARQTYVQLRPGSKLPDNKGLLARFLRSYDPDMVTNLKNAGYKWAGEELPVTFRLQPLLSLHTDNWFHGWGFTDYAVIDPQTIWILLAIAIGILLIACINFTTLAIGRSAARTREVGVRKVIGAGKGQIVFQFLTEALLLSFVSAFLGLLLVKLVLPLFNQLAGRDLNFSSLFRPDIVLILIGVVVIGGLLAGSYPALVLSGFRPVEVLKSKVRVGGSNLFTRSLVTFQYAVSIILIVSTIIILQQARYLINKDPGFNKENVIAIDAAETDPNKVFPLFKQALVTQPGIIGIASASAGLGNGEDYLGYTDHGLSAAVNIVDADYIDVLGMQLVAGRNFERSFVNDTIKPVIINQTMMTAFGWTPDNAVGKEIERFQGGTARVIGVVKDFNYRPLSERVKNQLFITSKDKGFNHFYVRISDGDPSRVIKAVQAAWNSALSGVPMKYSFLDEAVNDYYKAEQKWSSMIGWAGGISIFLASIGLLGLIALAAINRTKEIGIRKILGATLADIVTLLSKDFLKLILLSFMIATPVAWYCMNRWLADYAYRISINGWVFVLAGLGAILIAMITISFQAIRAAMANPVKSLRTDG